MHSLRGKSVLQVNLYFSILYVLFCFYRWYVWFRKRANRWCVFGWHGKTLSARRNSRRRKNCGHTTWNYNDKSQQVLTFCWKILFREKTVQPKLYSWRDFKCEKVCNGSQRLQLTFAYDHWENVYVKYSMTVMNPNIDQKWSILIIGTSEYHQTSFL